MDLVSITSQEENERIYKYIRDTSKSQIHRVVNFILANTFFFWVSDAGDIFWTSGTRMIDGATWVWMSTAQVVDYTNWYVGQPDTVVDHCINILAQKDKGLFWTDANCLLRYAYICEKPRERILFERNGIVTSETLY